MVILFLLTIFGPVIFWFWFFVWLDRAEPEPKKNLFKVFLLGAGTAILVSGIESVLWQAAFGHRYDGFVNINAMVSGAVSAPLLLLLVGAAVVEESVKFLILKEYIYDNGAFNQIGDGVFYGVTLALGFAMVENIGYFISIGEANRSILVGAAIVRGLFSLTLHMVATGVSGLALARKKFRPQHPAGIIYRGLLAAMLLHAAFNVFTQLGAAGLLLMLAELVGALWYIIRSASSPESKLVWRLVTPKP